MTRIGIIGLAHSNYRSVVRAIQFLGNDLVIVKNPDELEAITHLILPGVSSFGTVVSDLHEMNIYEPVKSLFKSKVKVLGLCAGMQIMGVASMESPNIAGFSWFDFECLPLTSKEGQRLFHTGWNIISASSGHAYSRHLIDEDFYFNHSFFISKDSNLPEDHASAIFQEIEIVAFIQSNNVWGVQFHPEKSQSSGLKVLSEFVQWQS